MSPTLDILCKKDSMLDEPKLSPELRFSLHNKSNVE